MTPLPDDRRQRAQVIEEIRNKARRMVDEAVKQRKIYKMRYAVLDLKIQILLDEVRRIKKERGIE